MSGLLNTAISGLRVSQNALKTTGHNIANANTEGYSRQRTESATNLASASGAGYIGNGVQTTAVKRSVDEFVIEQLRIDSSLHGELSAFNENVRQLDTLLSDPATGLSQALDSFFASVQNGADDPTSIPARQLVVSEADNLVARYNTLYERFDTLNNGVNESLDAAVNQINSLASNVAELNKSISSALGFSDNPPNDLLDQRDEALRQLSELVAIQTYDQGQGQVNVIVGGGQSLVVGGVSRQLTMVDGQLNGSQKDIAFQDDQGTQVITSFLSGGEVGGLLSFRDTSLNESYNELGRVALVMADTFNQVHQQGLDLNSQFGGLFFSDINASSVVSTRAFGANTNTQPADGTLNVFIDDSSQLTSSDYELRISNSNASFRIVRLSDDAEVAAGALPNVLPFSVEFDGVELSFASGTFHSGDRYLIQPTRTGARDIQTAIFRPEELAFSSPISTEASLGNTGSAAINAGELLSLEDVNGNPLPTFATQGAMNPPLMIRFTSPTTYEVLDNSDPGNPVSLDPPLRNQQFIPGVTKDIFTTDPGETRVTGSGALLGLASANSASNGYPSEQFTFTTTDPNTGLSSTQLVVTNANDSAKAMAAALSAVPGVSANARNYVEVSDVSGLTLSSPLQVTLGGENLIEYSSPGVISSNVPDPATEPGAFYDYLAGRINNNSNLQAQGIYSVSGTDTGSGLRELRISSSQGDDLAINLEAGAGETLGLDDGTNTATLTGAGAGVTDDIVVGGAIDVTLASNITMGTNPLISGIFGDSSAPDFAQSTYLGIQASISGIPDAGDTFSIDFNADGVTDNRNALAIADLSLEKLVDGNRTTYSDTYGALVEQVGIRTNSSEINLQASEQILTQTTDLRNSISGVNLDEEAANLIQFEQIYNANAQVIAVSRDLFDRLISIF